MAGWRAGSSQAEAALARQHAVEAQEQFDAHQQHMEQELRAQLQVGMCRLWGACCC